MQSLIGTGVALVTPFKADFSIDTEALTRIVNFSIDGGVEYLVILGTTAENATLSASEKEIVITTVVEANKGRLPWPVVNGSISQYYGDQPHPVHKNLTVHNSGIEITTEAGASARAVFAGEVLQVQVISANNKAVYIQHGDFITVYLNLASVSVSKGQKVSIKQSIGRIHTDASGKAVIKFLVLQNTTTLNPTAWLNM
jgi:murein DD-endopeptidase MepM/ murein hydrolase activator NlpD